MVSLRPESSEQEKTLVSWKEIASFLDRAERTVKRWERERGLPVHRVPGGERGGVYAYPSELADWLRGKSSELEEEDSVSGHDGYEANSEVQAPVVLSEVTAVSPPNVNRRSLRLVRVSAWLAPLALAATVILYLSGIHFNSHVKAVGDRALPNPGVPDLALDAVAVLPFTNAGGDPASEYLTDGITESLIGNLAHIPQLKVRSRDSVFRLKGRDIQVQEAGNALGVSRLVSGRVTIHANNIEVSTELTDVRDNTEIWGKQYAGKMSDLIQLQEQIAGDIAKEMRSSLSPEDKLRVTRQGTQNMEAYTLYLKGRYGWNQRSLVNLGASIPYFNQAIAKDPNYALAYSAIADVYSVLPYFGGNPAEDFPKAITAAREALRLDATLAHPHAILGSIEMEHDWDFTDGEAEFRKAFALDPNDATAHQWFAESLGAIGREPEALNEIDLAHLLDPTSLVIRRVKGSVYVAARHYDDAIAVCQQLLTENPTFNLAHDCLGYAYWAKHMYPQVIKEWTTFHLNTGEKKQREFGEALERGFRASGWHGALAEAIKVRISQHQTAFASAYQIARFYADLGDKEKAFEWLNTAYREHDFLLGWMNTDFGMDPLRADPRFAELVRKVGLPKLH